MNLKTCARCEERYFQDDMGISPAFTKSKEICDRCKKREKEAEEKTPTR